MIEKFNKWWMKNSYKVPLKCSFDLYPEFQDCWRAALEETLKQLNDIYGGDFENSDIVKWIKKELGDT